MGPSSKTKKDESQRSSLMELPVELHLRIRNQLQKDPDTTLEQLRSLRLVCKGFDAVWSPVVNTNLVLFPGGPDSLVQLRYLVDGKGNAYPAAYTSITIKNFYSVESAIDQWRNDIREFYDQGFISMFRKVGTSTIAAFSNILNFYLILLSGVLPFLFLVKFLLQVPRHVKNYYNISQAKNHVVSLPRKLDLPNVCSARLLYDQNESEWSISQSSKILLSLPKLTELELSIAETTDVEHLVQCLEQLTGLQKIRLLSSTVTPSQIRSIGKLVSRNEHLTHLDSNWKPSTDPLDISEFFDKAMTIKLKLEHVSLNGHCTNIEALVPHIQSLSSFEFHSSDRNTWCGAFKRERVFPPKIKADVLDSELVSYIGAHPGIKNMTVTAGAVSVDAYPDSIQYPSLFKALVQHSESLKHLSINTEILPLMLQTPAERMSFLKCVIDLQEITLLNDRTLAEYRDPVQLIQDEMRILPVIALGRTVTLKIRCKDKAIYTLCVEFCRTSSNPLLQDLVRRIVYEKENKL